MKIIIAALGYNHVIGAGDQMPWWVPEEYQQFLNFISGQTVIIGRKSYDIFSKDLPSKRNFVISRQKKFYARAIVFPSLDKALREASIYDEDIYIAGGATIYEQTMDVADRMYLSYIKGDFKGDVYFPRFDPSKWNLQSRVDYPSYEFFIYAKNSFSG